MRRCDMFWWGLICGLFVGANVGLFLAALCIAAAKGDRLNREALAKKGES
jgi:gas vesicle protein